MKYYIDFNLKEAEEVKKQRIEKKVQYNTLITIIAILTHDVPLIFNHQSCTSYKFLNIQYINE